MGVGGRFDFTRQPGDHLSVLGGDVVIRGLCIYGSRVLFDISVGCAVPHYPSEGGVESSFVGGYPPRWWVIGQSLSHGGGGCCPGGKGGSSRYCSKDTSKYGPESACTLVSVIDACPVRCPSVGTCAAWVCAVCGGRVAVGSSVHADGRVEAIYDVPVWLSCAACRWSAK